MKRIFFVLLTFITALEAEAQINELGIFAGGSNYIGDIGPTNYIAPDDLAIGLLYKWNRSPRHSYRASFTYGKISSNDADSDNAARQQRGYSFKNSIKELSLGMEFNFFEFNQHEPGFLITPYVFGGISLFRHDQLYINNGETFEDEAKNGLAIPMIVGVKSKVSESIVIGFEIGARYTFTDNLDGSNHKNYPQLSFGNLESKDWYVFSGFTLTYTFGDKPCYCAE